MSVLHRWFASGFPYLEFTRIRGEVVRVTTRPGRQHADNCEGENLECPVETFAKHE
jgi:hypothetical protein